MKEIKLTKVHEKAASVFGLENIHTADIIYRFDEIPVKIPVTAFFFTCREKKITEIKRIILQGKFGQVVVRSISKIITAKCAGGVVQVVECDTLSSTPVPPKKRKSPDW
jgi:hypothetical protein